MCLEKKLFFSQQKDLKKKNQFVNFRNQIIDGKHVSRLGDHQQSARKKVRKSKLTSKGSLKILFLAIQFGLYESPTRILSLLVMSFKLVHHKVYKEPNGNATNEPLELKKIFRFRFAIFSNLNLKIFCGFVFPQELSANMATYRKTQEIFL